ncbi:ABC transporter substrate-binding protein [uncultured Cohaesibacter sp.]|uniref:ABC transporter substrate-binding protein n=1 Tax=uncultured Cohaesibacter sp. TaxID=1002546 RepID=UPI00292D378E|nr:ABC transporter substrate-binding protein [uncultured Cohaesibacter sp.]
MKRLMIAALMLSGSALTAQAADCGKITIADMNWNSATLIANIDRFILEHGFGCEAELVPGDTMPTGASMTEKGEPDIAPEFWVNAMRAAIDKGVEEGRLAISGVSLTDGGEEGFWVPAYMVEKDPSLATIEGVLKNAKLFPHPEDDSISGFYGCPAGWNCQISSGNLFKALKLDEAGFEMVDPGSGAGLAGAIAKAYERGEGWFGYYWAPTAVLGRYKMVKVDFGSGIDEKMFRGCITQEDCTDPKPTMYPPSEVWTVVTSEFAKGHDDINAYLAKRSFKNADMNGYLAWMEDNQANGEDAAAYFLSENEDKWSAWLPADIAAKVKEAVAGL